jgi:osmotically-inducible protein OsmY
MLLEADGAPVGKWGGRPMAGPYDALVAVRKALYSEPRIDLAHHPIRLTFSDGDLVIAGEVADIAAKKLALERAAAAADVRGIVDRLRITPAERMGDGAIRDLVRDALLAEPALAACSIRVSVKQRWEPVRIPDGATGAIDITVEDGVVTLDGDVAGLGLKRLAGILAWWVPGSRDVINGLGVTPPEDDNDGEISDAVRMALEKDPLVNPDQIRISTRDAVVTLQGQVPTESECEAAEFDAWYVFGVDKVVNQIRVRA